MPRLQAFSGTNFRGFGLKVTPSGSRSYVFQYRMGGRETTARRYTIGTHGSPWTPTTAREEAERLALMVRQGVDPREHQRERRRELVELAFRGYAQRFLKLYVIGEWPASYDFAESILRLHVVPVLGEKPLPKIGKSDITDVLDRLPPSKPALKRNVYAVLRRLLRWAVGRGDLDRSPLEGFEAPASVPSRERVLNDAELALVWKASSGLGYPFGPMFQLLMITGQRREEVAGLKWEELDRSSAAWLLPAERSKNGKSHIVPLSAPAAELLDSLAQSEKWPRKGFVFTTTGTTAVSGYSRAKRRLDVAMRRILGEMSDGLDDAFTPLAAWRVHDLRRTLATGLQRLGVRFEVTEAVLNHVSGARSGVAGVYQRHDWADEKRDALARWAQALERIISNPTAALVPGAEFERDASAATARASAMTGERSGDWREALSELPIRKIERAISQFHADERYEREHGKLSETLHRLKQIEAHSRGLMEAITDLSPVGSAAVHDAGMKRGIVSGRYELGGIVRRLVEIPELASAAVEILLAMHSPLPDEEQGQGTGSAIGRDFDLRAIKAEHDRSGISFEFRSPEGKLGVAVIKTYLRHQPAFNVSERGAGRALDMFLRRVWEDVRPGRPTNWKRLGTRSAGDSRSRRSRHQGGGDLEADFGRSGTHLPRKREDRRRVTRRLIASLLIKREELMSTLRVREAAGRLGLSASTLNKWRTQGRGPRFVKLGRAVCYRPADLDAWPHDQVRSSTSEYSSP